MQRDEARTDRDAEKKKQEQIEMQRDEARIDWDAERRSKNRWKKQEQMEEARTRKNRLRCRDKK
jgi:hypothetical protein